METGGSLRFTRHEPNWKWQQTSLTFSERLCLKGIMQTVIEKDNEVVFGLYEHEFYNF